jgi:hypothetical protein
MTTVTVAAIDPGVKNVGLAVRKYMLRGGKLGRILETWNLHISANTPVLAARMVVTALRPVLGSLRLVLCEDFAFSSHFGIARLGQFVGGVEYWVCKHHVAFVRVGISRAKKGINLKGNCNRKTYVKQLRKLYPIAASDDSRVSLAILDTCAQDEYDGDLFSGGLDDPKD